MSKPLGGNSILKQQNRVILHIDYDSFFASVEQQANRQLRGKPIAVGGSSLTKSIVCSASKEAKKYGVKTAMPLFKAKKLCPEIIGIKGDGTKYSYIHNESLKIFGKYTDLVEPFSIDECFLDVTNTLKFFDNPINLALQIKKDIRQMFGEVITCSIGIGPNKITAKLVSDWNKPNGIYHVTQQNLQDTLLSAQLSDFCGIGKRISIRLENLGITTVKQLQEIDVETLYLEFGNISGHTLKNMAFGIDYSEVKPSEYKRTPKSIGHQHTLKANTYNRQVINRNLLRLSEMVARRMRRHNVVGKTVSLYLRDSNKLGYHERLTNTRAIDNGYSIYEATQLLLKKANWNKETRLVGVSMSNLVSKSHMPIPLLPQEARKERIMRAADLINDKFGEYTMIPANTVLADQTKGKISSFLKHQ
ncbi:DNA polymerase IV [candidate division WWE3 bacterium]|uniref:DNA polymerase IV n=1 Tax=candidate division WWE3 bacterium TaxID=2053526 RepID=A0A955EBS2_UNCKA|nr:DNA polymerase IV [candidate division WWE3 bacterium]MCB0367878.1 DNA polymerase IV [Bdellovibrionales bacterium]